MALPRTTAIGRVVDEPVVRWTKGGDAVLGFRMACNERKKDPDGNWVDGRSIFLSVSVWRAAAESAADEITKGMEVAVEGRLHEREYDKDGQTRRSLELDADTIARVWSGRPKTDQRQTVPAAFADEDPF